MRFAIFLAGGTGRRMGEDIPKQYLLINGRLLLSYGLETLFSVGKKYAPLASCERETSGSSISGVRSDFETIRGVCVVAHPDYRPLISGVIKEILQRIDNNGTLMPPGIRSNYDNYDSYDNYNNHDNHDGRFFGFADPGDNRQLSILNGLKFLHNALIEKNYDTKEAVVLIQDAVRPLSGEGLIRKCFETVEAGKDAAIPVLPMKDTLYLSQDGKNISGLLERDKIFAGQAPEAFRLLPYLKATEALLPDRILDIRGSTEPAVLYGLSIGMIPGEEINFKVTTKEDLERFKRII